MKNFALIAKPLHDPTKKGTNLVWSDQSQTLSDNLRKEISRTPVLAHPDFKLFKFQFSSSEPLGKFQPNLAQSILG